MTRPPLKSNLARLLLLVALLTLWGCGSQNSPGNLGTIEQDSGAVVAGTVHNTKGDATPDAVITLEAMVAGRAASVASRTGLVSDLKATKSLRTAVTDEQGRYAIDELGAGEYLLTTSLRDHDGATSRFVVSAAAAALAETTVVDIQLLPTGTILGQATRENATDHSGTVVFVDGTSYVAVTDAAGSFSLTGVPIGLRPVHGTYPGFLDDATTATLIAAGDTATASDLFLRQSANMPPVVDTINASQVPVGTPTDFSAGGHDPDGVIVRWEWDFQNDGVFDVSSTIDGAAAFVYPAAGQYLAKLRVTDDQDGYGLAVVSVMVQDLPTGAIFVADTGADNNIGSALQPVRTISQGLVLAQAAGLDSVLVSSGEFPGVVNLIDGISIYGGRDPISWETTAGYSHLTGDVRPLRGTGITSSTWLEGLHIESTNAVAPGEASVAVSLTNCSSLLEFHNCVVTAGNGAPGTAGTNGSFGAPGSNGTSGLPGQCDSTPSRPGGSGGAGFYSGGSGGTGGNAGNNGFNGTPGAYGGGGTPGGSSGFTDNPGTNAGNGSDGAPGNNGTNGSPVASIGSLIGGLWQANTSGAGSAGTGGRGGGGGGGGGGQEGIFVDPGVGGSGGGGGGGGFPGQPGGGGHGGGASIGFLLDNATPVIANCTVNRGSGGTGGRGGNGGDGGNGGYGGTQSGRDCSDVGLGGHGGKGGDGGWGGSGAGGPGGPSYGIFGANGGTVTDTSTINFVGGQGGNGGPGGSGAGTAPSGTAGQLADLLAI